MTGLERREEMIEQIRRSAVPLSGKSLAEYCVDPGSRVSCDFNKQRLRIGTAGSCNESI